jgi:hypothetical protein
LVAVHAAQQFLSKSLRRRKNQRYIFSGSAISMKPMGFLRAWTDTFRVVRMLAIPGILIFTSILVMTSAASFAQTPPPINFVSGQLFSGVGHGDRIPGAAGVITLAVGDFNNDGKLDLITTNSDVNENGLGLVLGNGDGTFQYPIEVAGFAIYGSMGAIVAGDFNKDGKLDFATTWSLGGPVQVSVYLNDGTGHFTFNNSHPIGTTLTRQMATVDLNSDGKLDLIVPDPSNSAVAVLYGNGDGTFQPAVDFPAAVPGQTAPTGVAIGDFNKDGKPDIVVASSTGCCPHQGGISVLLNSTPGAPVLYLNPNGTDSGQVAVADLNADGKLDVVLSSMGGQGIAVFLGVGNGTFQAAKNMTVPWASSVAIGNFTSDKKPDLVVSSYYDGTVWALVNKGSGNFQVSGVYSSDWSAMAIVLADFNGDKKLDFVAGNSTGQYVTLGLGNGDGTFRSSAHYNESGGMWTNGFSVADFNLDGSPDVIQAGGGTGVGLSLMLGNSHGVLGTPTYIALGGSPYSQVMFALADDVNGDKKPDIVSSTAEGYGNPYGVVVMLGMGTGKFKPGVVYTTSPSSYPAVGVLADVNNDGKLDILTSNNDGTFSVLLNTGKGVYGAATVIHGCLSHELCCRRLQPRRQTRCRSQRLPGTQLHSVVRERKRHVPGARGHLLRGQAVRANRGRLQQRRQTRSGYPQPGWSLRLLRREHDDLAGQRQRSLHPGRRYLLLLFAIRLLRRAVFPELGSGR